MNSILEYIQNHPQEAQRLLGLRYDQLKQLLQKAIELHNQKQAMAQSEKVTLTYLRHLTTFQLLAIHFGVSETTANDIFNYCYPIVCLNN